MEKNYKKKKKKKKKIQAFPLWLSGVKDSALSLQRYEINPQPGTVG